jgi:hypothetical protein
MFDAVEHYCDPAAAVDLSSATDGGLVMATTKRGIGT